MFGLFEKPKIIAKAIDGNKSYLVVLAFFALAILDGAGIVEVPKIVYEALPFLGLGTLRHGMKKAEKAAEEAMKSLDRK